MVVVEERHRTDQEKLAKLRAESGTILRRVDESPILQSHQKRLYPTFRRDEIETGKLLGVGGFGIVFEVLELHVEDKEEDPPPRNGPDADDGAKKKSGVRFQQPQQVDGTTKSMAENGSSDDKAKQRAIQELGHVLDSPTHRTFPHDDDNGGVHETHYEVESARKLMADHVMRKGDARYAMKRLHRELSELNRMRGMIDLAIEAKYLSVIWHPNIVKMRAMAAGDVLRPDFFFLMDRLYETLNQRFGDWKRIEADSRPGFLGLGGDKQQYQALLVDRLTVAYDVAAAMTYLHKNKIVYRDIKQENIGFDVRGDVKVFDFGLCTSLLPERKNNYGYGYQLTPRTGSVPYMAPEVADDRPYNEKCDVFSFAILLWEILALKQAFKGYSRKVFLYKVAKGGERPPTTRSWPTLTRMIMKEAWDRDPRQRPTMKRVADIIRGDLKERTVDPTILQRTRHMRDRSAHSFRLSRGTSSIYSEGVPSSQLRESNDHGLEFET